MTSAVFSKAVTLWAGILLLAILNGALREAVLIPELGLVIGTMLSGAVLCSCIFVTSFAAYPWWGQLHERVYWKIGVLWMALTLTFELLFGLCVRSDSWQTMLAAYSFKDGNLWPLVLVSTLTAPVITARLKQRG